MADTPLFDSAVEPVPNDYPLPAGADRVLKSVSASFDGTSAGADFQPAVQILSPSGAVVVTCSCPTVLAAGASADVSWFPFVGSASSSTTTPVVGARISASVSQTIPNATATDLVYDTVDFDTDGMANLVADNRKLTVVVPGLYLVACSVIWTYNGTGGRLVNVTHNTFYSPLASSVGGDERPAVWASPIGGSGGAPRTSNTASVLVNAVAGDFFASGCGQYSGAGLVCNGVSNGNINNYLSAILLGEII